MNQLKSCVRLRQILAAYSVVLPNKLPVVGPIHGVFCPVENLTFRFFHSLNYAFSLVRVTRPLVQGVRLGIANFEFRSI